MDPQADQRIHDSRRFPRTRGDGPVFSWVTSAWDKFPPHARGWTRGGRGREARCSVSPARAGMDRQPEEEAWTFPGFPRTRGDGPKIAGYGLLAVMLPPHARGWTYAQLVGISREAASPARAGMDRTPTRNGRATWSFPRTRGDGPLSGTRQTAEELLPPHARGWTDGWMSEHRHVMASPARAGMDRPPFLVSYSLPCFPRTRGDGPVEHLVADSMRWLPPHARGWTLKRGQDGGLYGVSPARAGMDRCEIGNIFLVTQFPPHARGWTETWICGCPTIPVSPARAGMDRRGRIRSGR